MRGNLTTLITGMLLACSSSAHAKVLIDDDAAGNGPGFADSGVLQCVPFARDTSGIRLYGDAHTWWKQADGKYARGRVPQPGAVLAIRPHGNSSLGHVATVSRVIDARTILISHANWSAPGKIERNVTAVDVSPSNDWSQVRVWYAPVAGLGGSHWPVAGFIYNAKPEAKAKARSSTTLTKFVPSKTRVRFSNEPLFASSRAEPVRTTRAKPSGAGGAATAQASARSVPVRVAKVNPRQDPIGAILASSR